MSNYYFEINNIMIKFMKKFSIMNNDGIQLAGFKDKFNFTELLFIVEIGNVEKIFLKKLIETFENDRKLVINVSNKLFKIGVIDRRKSSLDGRIMEIFLTTKGKLIFDSIKKRGDELLEFALKDLSINEEKAILKYFSKMLQTTVVRPKVEEFEKKNLTSK